MRRLRPAWWAIALLAIACSKPSQPWVDRLEVDAFEGGELISLTSAQLEAQLSSKLAASRFELARADRPAPAEVKPWRVRLAVGLTEPDLEQHTSIVGLALELRHVGSSESFTIDVRREVKPPKERDVEAMQNAIRDALDAAMGQAVRECAATISLEAKSNAELAVKLEDKDPAVRDAAVRLLVAHGDKAALRVLLVRLASDDLDVVRTVMGQLIELRAAEAVNPLIEAASRRGPQFQREVVFAIGAIGGSDAEAYLDLVSTGHDDPLVRASAEQALQELRTRKTPTPRGEPR